MHTTSIMPKVASGQPPSQCHDGTAPTGGDYRQRRYFTQLSPFNLSVQISSLDMKEKHLRHERPSRFPIPASCILSRTSKKSRNSSEDELEVTAVTIHRLGEDDQRRSTCIVSSHPPRANRSPGTDGVARLVSPREVVSHSPLFSRDCGSRNGPPLRSNQTHQG
ncbi:hypothetical protein VTI74DRAFT_5477 [Chaetomium olivicolor]